MAPFKLETITICMKKETGRVEGVGRRNMKIDMGDALSLRPHV